MAPLEKPSSTSVPLANTPLAFFGIHSQEEPAETAPEPAPPPAGQLPAVHPAPFSWPPQQPTPAPAQGAAANSLGWAPGAPPITHTPQQLASLPLQAAQPVNHPPPTWPGLGLEGSDQRNHPFASLFGRDAFAPSGQPASATGTEHGTTAPPASKRASPVLVLLLLAIIGGTFWYAWKNRAKLLKLVPSSQSETVIPFPSLEFAPDALSEPAPAVAGELAIDPLDAATPDITQNIAAADRAAVLVKSLDAAINEEDRLKVILHAQEHKADVKRFFDSLGNQLKPILLDPTPAVVSPLLTGPKLRLFRLVTATCAKGAILHLAEGPNDTQLLDWPLFMQTHEQHFDRFVKSNPPPDERKAEWFTVLCKRRHDFDLPKDSQEAYLCLEAQGSLSPEGSTVLYVNKGLPAGRLLETHLKWAEIYLVDLLVGKAEIAGKSTHVILDCTGTDTARK